jgi:hypothetical protein
LIVTGYFADVEALSIDSGTSVSLTDTAVEDPLPLSGTYNSKKGGGG